MTAPTTHELILSPPNATHPDLFNNNKERYNFYYELWKRSGGYQSAVTNLKGLKASVAELNELIGIRTDDTVQEQIDAKANTADLGSMAYQNSVNIAVTGGTVTGATITRSAITIRAGISDEDIPLSGTLHTDTTAVGNVGAGEDTLISYVMPANVLSADHSYLEVSAYGTVAANGNNKTIKLKIGTTTLFTTGVVAANAGSWWITAQIIRKGAGSEDSIAKIISSNALISNITTYTAAVENTAATLNIFCTGEGSADDDIIQKGLIIKWFA